MSPDTRPPATGRIDPDQLADLEEERRFLLRSLSDLERERAAGDVDDEDYDALRDGYTSRAAAVLRTIDAGRSELGSNKPPRRLGRVVTIAASVVVLGIVLGVLVARFASPRGTDDTITGGTDEDRISALLTDGRTAMGQGDYAAATDTYREVLDIESENVEARAYLGWVITLASQQLEGESQANTLAAGKQGLLDAIVADGTYADSYCFLAIVAAQFEDDIPTATTRRDECLAHEPSSEMRGLMAQQVTPFIEAATGAPASDVGTTTTLAE